MVPPPVAAVGIEATAEATEGEPPGVSGSVGPEPANRSVGGMADGVNLPPPPAPGVGLPPPPVEMPSGLGPLPLPPALYPLSSHEGSDSRSIESMSLDPPEGVTGGEAGSVPWTSSYCAEQREERIGGRQLRTWQEQGKGGERSSETGEKERTCSSRSCIELSWRPQQL